MRFRLLRALLLSLPLIAAAPMAQSGVTTPRAQFGFDIGDDYQLVNYTKIAAYWRKLDAESDRLVVKEIGKTSEGRPQLMAIVTSPANHKNLAKYQDIARRLALAEGLTPEAARTLARQGKAVVWIDGGLHANETLGAQQLVETIYQMVSRNDEETLRFLDECILLFVHANPDGNELVADWYMRNPDPLKRSAAGLPRLYHHYIGHDNNRDFFASTQAETENINRVLYHEWLPQILYNHHQSGPAGTVVWSSPQRDPYNYNLDPLLILGLQALGTHMHQRLASEGKPGATMASGGPYDGWWNGGIRNTGNFHNIIAILTETIGNPTPMRIPLVLERQIPNRDLPFPIAPQEWRFRQSIDYSISFNRAVIDYAARNREHLLYDIYAMGRRAIARGSEDSWTPSPTRIKALADQAGGGRGGSPERDAEIWAALRRPEHRDPRGYIIPSNQRDFLTAIKFVNALREVNVAVHRATKEFDVAGSRYPAGSFVVMTAQAFRPHVLDMFEPQDHPNVIPYPGAPPTPPYDNAGWTLAYQMGVEFVRVLEPFSGPFERVTDWNVKPAAGTIAAANGAAGYVISRQVNDAAIAVNRLLRANETVHAGQDFYVAAGPSTSSTLHGIAKELGINATAAAAAPPADARRLAAPRIGLWDQYGGSMDSGWTRWLLEQYRVHVRTRFRAKARRRQSQRQLRRDRLSRRRHSCGGGERARRPRRRAACRHRGASGVPIAGRTRHSRTDSAGAAGLRRSRRYDRGDWRLGRQPGFMVVAARREPPGRERRAHSARQILRAGIRPRRQSGCLAPAGGRAARANGFLLRQQPRVQTRAGRGTSRPEANRDLRFRDAASQRLGMGTGVSERRRDCRRRPARQGTSRAASGSAAPRPAPRHVQAAVQQPVSQRGAKLTAPELYPCGGPTRWRLRR